MNQNKEKFINEMSQKIQESLISKQHQKELIDQLVLNMNDIDNEHELFLFKDNYQSMVDELIGQYPKAEKIVILTDENNEMDKLISGENKEKYEDLILYMRGSNIDDQQQEIIRSDLIRMILDAQNRGDSIDELIGYDSKEFMDNIIESFEKKSMTRRILENSIVSVMGVSILFVVISVKHLIRTLFNGQGLSMDIPILLGDLLSMILIILLAFTVVNYITKNPFKSDRKTVGGVAMIAVILAVLLISSLPLLLKQELFRVNFFIGFLGLLLILVLLQTLYKKIRSSN